MKDQFAMTQDFVSQFSWNQFLSIALIYTLAPILSSARWGKSRDIHELLVAVKASPFSALGIHLVFLGLLLATFWVPAHHYSSRPGWLKRPISSGVTALDLIVLALFIGMVATEEKFIKSTSNANS